MTASLTRAQRRALHMIEQADEGEAYLVVATSFTESGGGFLNRVRWTQAFINYRTAAALERAGLVRIEGQGEDAKVYLAAQDGGQADG